jgi:chloramphenicol-sensitive protein RarD
MFKAYITLLAGYLGWGLFPLYWQLLSHVSPLEVTMHRIVWSVPVLALLVHLSPRRQIEFKSTVHSGQQLKLLLITALLITINWGVYVWAVAHARVLEASMGYFLTPLINIAAGVLIFQEKLSRLKWLAIGFAVAGVLFYIISLDTLPWVAITVGVSFSSYGILRKKIFTGPIVGLYTETLMMAPFALAVLLYLQQQNTALFLNFDLPSDAWLILGGLVTVVPLVLFTTGARSLPMSSVGILFFITPSIQFLMGTLVLGEPVNMQKLIAFSIIWSGLILYSVSLLKQSRLGNQVQREL